VSDDLDAIDERLRQQGNRKREMTVVDRILGIGVDVDDLHQRRERQGRRKQVVAIATVAAALVLSAGAVAATVVVPRAAEPFAAPPASPAEPTGPSPSGSAGGTRAYTPPSTAEGTTTRGTEDPVTSAPRTTTAPASPTTMAAPTPNGRARGIREVDVVAVAEREADCGSRPNGKASPVVSHVDYGNVVGDGNDDAVVTISCPGDRSTVRASLYSLAPSSPTGVRRVANVEPDPTSRALLMAQSITGWTLTRVALVGSTVESYWTAVRRLGPAGGLPRTFALRQRWTGGGWLPLAPLQVSPASR
jgi:hypothetical protein